MRLEKPSGWSLAYFLAIIVFVQMFIRKQKKTQFVRVELLIYNALYTEFYFYLYAEFDVVLVLLRGGVSVLGPSRS